MARKSKHWVWVLKEMKDKCVGLHVNTASNRAATLVESAIPALIRLISSAAERNDRGRVSVVSADVHIN